jgi:UDP-glucose:(heptosyl)LPS alpha-1,3-glucosyltransferase
MKVAVVIERIEPWRGGAETSTTQFIHQLARRGCDVHVLTASRVPDSPDMTVHSVPVPRPTRSAQTAQFMRRADAMIEESDFDIVHSMLPIARCDVYQPRGGTVAESVERNLALIRSPLLRRMKRVVNHLNAKQQSLLRQEARAFSPGNRHIVAALSRYVVRQLHHHYRLDNSRVRLVFNGVDVPDVNESQRLSEREAIRRQYALDDRDLALLLVAHNFKLKGVIPCLEAMARLARQAGPPTKVLIVGRDNPARYLRLAERLGIAGRVIFVGPTERITSFYSAADLCVHPAYYDPCSRVVLEALACGLPAITTRHNGASEVIEEGIHGYVIDSADSVEQLADRIGRLADPDHRRQCAENGRRLRDRLSMARHADELLAVYHEILGQRRGS